MRREWSPDEEGLLVGYVIADMDDVQIGAKLGRSARSVQRKRLAVCAGSYRKIGIPGHRDRGYEEWRDKEYTGGAA